MKELTVFKHEEFGEVRIIDQNDSPWFVAKDVAKALGYENISRDVQRHCKKVNKISQSTDSVGPPVNILIIPESDVYRLIMRSNMPKAVEFQDWVVEEVLPSIRKTGVYMPKNLPEALREYADALDRETQLKIENQKMQPKAEYFDQLVERNLLTNFRDTAKELKIGQAEFINYLLENNYIYRDERTDLKPYMKHVPDLFEIKEWTKTHISGTQTLITPRGRETFRMLLSRLTLPPLLQQNNN